MKSALLLSVFALAPTLSYAQLEIQPQTDNPLVEQRFKKMQSAAAARSAAAAGFPTFEQFNESVSRAKSENGTLSTQTLESPSRPMIEKLNCKFANQTPSGVERKSGGLNGVMTVYACEHGYVITYETNYESELTQRVIIIDDDYAKVKSGDEPLIKEATATRGHTRFTSLRWLDVNNEVKYEIFTDLQSTEDTRLERSLKGVLKDVALKLSAAK